MFEIIVRERFCGAHKIEGYHGRCAELHGHNWTVEMRFGTEKLNELGMAFDFRAAKRILKNIICSLDHTYLNDNPLLSGENPTAERLAKIIYDEVQKRVPQEISVLSATVWESENTAVEYRIKN